MDSKLMVFFLQCLKNEKEPLALFQANVYNSSRICSHMCNFVSEIHQKVKTKSTLHCLEGSLTFLPTARNILNIGNFVLAT